MAPHVMAGLSFDEAAKAVLADDEQVRQATIRECAAIAKAHKGAAARARREKGKSLHLGVDGYDEIVSEERGEDIAAEIIERAILALASPSSAEGRE